jgi:hypothetical protein
LLNAYDRTGFWCCRACSFLYVLGCRLSWNEGYWHAGFLNSIGILCVVCFGPCRFVLYRDMPIDTPSLFGLFDPSYFLLSCWAGVTPCSMSTFAYCVLGGEPFHSLLLAVFRVTISSLCLAKLTRLADCTMRMCRVFTSFPLSASLFFLPFSSPVLYPSVYCPS